MKLKEIVSCYLTKCYHCDRATYDALVQMFEDRSNVFEEDWEKRVKSDTKVVFKKRAPVALTFDYSGEKLEVQVVFEYDDQKHEMKLSVGNWGFPFEPLISKKRYLELVEKIHGAIIETGETIEEFA